MENNNPLQSENHASLRLGRLILQLRRLESTPRTFGRAGALTPSEIHTIDAIGTDEGLLMKELAERLGVTKGAVSQLVDRLEAKTLVRRTAHPKVSRGIQVVLTDKGREAYRVHADMHAAFYEELQQSFTKEEIAIFEQCVSKLRDILSE